MSLFWKNRFHHINNRNWHGARWTQMLLRFWGCLAWNKQKITQKRVTFGCQIRATTWLIMHDGGRMAVSHDLRVSPSTFDCSASSHLFQRPDEADRETYMESNCRMWRRRLRRKSLERKWWKIDFLVCFYFLFLSSGKLVIAKSSAHLYSFGFMVQCFIADNNLPISIGAST